MTKNQKSGEITKEQALENLKQAGTIVLSYNDGITCREELEALGLNINSIKSSLHQANYYSCSICFDHEHHHTKDLNKEIKKIHKLWNEIEELQYVDFEIEY